MPALATFARLSREAFTALVHAWSRIWFQSMPTTPLEITRIGVGAVLLFNYVPATPYLHFFWGDDGWMFPSLLFDGGTDMWMQSVFFYFTVPWQWIAFHIFFLFCCLAFMLGWRTSWVKWVVLIGQISYAYRNPALTYGVDQIVVALLVILCFAPIGRAMSLDRVRAVHKAKRDDIEARLPAYAGPWAGACIRLMQIQMAVLFFFSCVEKIRGDEWWDGDALWVLFASIDFYNGTVVDLFASQYWLVNVATYLTLLIEIAFPFLIWQRATRPYLLAAAIFLHLQFALFLGLPYFSFVMIMGHMSFLRPEWLARLGVWWKGRMGDMEMIYDGRCGFCVRSMKWFTSFDGLGQIRMRDFRTNPSPVVSNAEVEKALYLVLPDGRALPGFEAYRYVVTRVPGLWWQAPFFYVPVISRFIGRPLYNWIAANRSRLSSIRLGLPRPPAN
jgi:predicted DCC family thiol-disulfide oxidoreductase YuxK